MNLLSTLGSFFQPQARGPQALANPWSNADQGRSLAQPAAAQDIGNVALSDAGKALAQRNAGDATSAMLQRAGDLGSATIDAATQFVSDFATSLFGDAAKGMSLSFDTSSISVSSSLAGAMRHTENSQGSSDAASLRLADVADFVGKGTITTADGHRFSFEVEVHYASSLEVSAASSSSTSNASAPASEATKTSGHHRQSSAASREGLTAHFPGRRSDFFKMLDQGRIDRPAQGQDDGDGNKSGQLNLRLLNLLASPEALNGKMARAYAEQDAPAQVAEQA